MAPSLLIFLPSSKKEQMVPSDRNTPDSFDGFCSLWLGSDLGVGGMRGMYSPHQPFSTMFLINTNFA